jgi:hypothetical protein
VPKDVKSEPKLSLMLKVIDEIFIKIYSWCFNGADYMFIWP